MRSLKSGRGGEEGEGVKGRREEAEANAEKEEKEEEETEECFKNSTPAFHIFSSNNKTSNTDIQGRQPRRATHDLY